MDAEELADETILRLVNNINTGKEIRTNKLYSYVYGIAQNVFLEYIRSRKKSEALSSAIIELVTTAQQSFDCQKICWHKLPHEKRATLEEYYSGEDREKLAERYKITLNALRLHVHRIKKDLKQCYEECEKESQSGRN